MPEMHILQDLVLIFAGSAVGLYVCTRLKLPPIVGFLLAGLVMGPFGFGLVKSMHDVEVLAEIGIVLLLFTIGIEFSIKDLLRSKRAVLLGGSLQVVLTIVISMVLSLQFGFAPNQAIFAGFLVALSSTAIVLRTLQDRAELDSAHGRLSLSILIFQDIIIAPMIILTPLLSAGSGYMTGTIVSLVLRALAVVVMVVVLARWVVPMVLQSVVRTRSRELFLFSIVLICTAVAWATNELGLSLGLGAFLAGLIISDSEYSLTALEGIMPFKTVFTGFFFVSIGMLLDTSLVLSQPLAVFGLSAGVMLVKGIIAAGVALMLGMSSRTAVIAGLSLSQVGEFSFILSRVGLSNDLISQDTYQLFLAFAVVTMAATPFIINIAPRLADAMTRWPGLRAFKEGSYRHLKDPAGQFQSLSDHLLIVGYGLNGQNVSRAARATSIPHVIIELNPDTVRHLRATGEPIIYGDATSAETLRRVGIDRVRIAVIAISDPTASRRIVYLINRENPNVHIIVRTRFISDMKALLDLGAQEVIPEEFETSVEIFGRVLSKYLVPRDEIEKLVGKIRSNSYRMFRSISRDGYQVSDLQLSGLEINSIRVDQTCELAGWTIAEADVRRKFGITILAVMRGGELIANPDSDVMLQSDDVLYVAGKHEHCTRAVHALGESR